MSKLIFVTLLTLLLSADLSAQVVRTWVATFGVDTNLCTKAEPCRTFSTAINAVSNNGEVVALDSGGYGPFLINKPVSVLTAAGIHAAIAATSGISIEITVGASDKVVLRNLYLNSQGSHTGLKVNSDGPVQMEGMVFRRFNFDGIFSRSKRLYIGDSVFTENGNGAFSAPLINGERLDVFITGCDFHNNQVGVYVDGGPKATVVDSVAAGGTYGFRAVSQGLALTELSLERCTATHNTNGIAAENQLDPLLGNVIVRVANSTITHNFQGIVLAQNGCELCVQTLSRGDNTLAANVIDGIFTGGFTPR